MSLVKQIFKEPLSAELIFKRTKNPAYLWLAIVDCLENNKEMPREARKYLISAGRDLLSEENSEDDLPQILKKAFGFTKKKQLDEISSRIHCDKIDGLILEYQEKNKVSKNKALKALKVTAREDEDKHLIHKLSNSNKESFKDLVYITQEACKGAKKAHNILAKQAISAIQGISVASNGLVQDSIKSVIEAAKILSPLNSKKDGEKEEE